MVARRMSAAAVPTSRQQLIEIVRNCRLVFDALEEYGREAAAASSTTTNHHPPLEEIIQTGRLVFQALDDFAVRAPFQDDDQGVATTTRTIATAAMTSPRKRQRVAAIAPSEDEDVEARAATRKTSTAASARRGRKPAASTAPSEDDGARTTRTNKSRATKSSPRKRQRIYYQEDDQVATAARTRKIPVIQFEAATGEFVAEHESILAAAKDCCDKNDYSDIYKYKSVIGDIVAGKSVKPILGKYFYRRANETLEQSAVHQALRAGAKHRPRKKPVVQILARTGDVVAEHESIAAAARSVCGPDADDDVAVKNCQLSIGKIVQGKSREPLFGKFLFRRAGEIRDDGDRTYQDDDDGTATAPTKKHRTPKIGVVQFDSETGDTVAHHDSIQAASIALCGPDADDVSAVKSKHNAITRMLAGNNVQPLLGKYYFRRADETVEESAVHLALEAGTKPRSRNRPVVQVLAKTGDEVGEYESITEAARSLCAPDADDDSEVKKYQNAIDKMVKGNNVKPILGKYFFRYAEEKPEESAVHLARQAGVKAPKPRKAPVVQFVAQSGSVVAEYDSILGAARSLSGPDGDDDVLKYKSYIDSMLAGKNVRPILDKYYFRRAGESLEESAVHKALESGVKVLAAPKKPVVQFSAQTGNVVFEHDSVVEAARSLCGPDGDDDLKRYERYIHTMLAGKNVKPILGKFFFRRAGETVEESAVHKALQAKQLGKKDAKMPPRRKPVVQFLAETGDIVAEYDSIRDATRALCGPDKDDDWKKYDNYIDKMLAGKYVRPILGKYFFRLAGETLEQSAVHKALEAGVKPPRQRNKPVVQFFAETGNVVVEYESIRDAAMSLCGPDGDDDVKKYLNYIDKMLAGKYVRPILGKYFFRLAGETLEQSAVHKALETGVKPPRQRNKPVVQFFAETGNVVAEYDSITDAAVSLCGADGDDDVKKYLNYITKMLAGTYVKPILGKYYFRRAGETLEDSAVHKALQSKTPDLRNKPVIQFPDKVEIIQLCAKTGDVVARHESVSAASRSFCEPDADAYTIKRFFNAIYRSLNGTTPKQPAILGDYVFRRANEEEPRESASDETPAKQDDAD